jgi:hypothetical protein
MNFLKKGLSQFAAAVGESARGAGSGSGSGTEASSTGSTSSSAAGRGSDGCSPLLDPSSLPEIRFDERDGDEAHVLFLWTVYAGAPANSPMQEEALESFTEGFVGAFDEWMPAEDAFAARQHQHQQRGEAGGRGGKGAELVTGCATGHPATVMRAFTAALRRVQASLEAALGVGTRGAAMRNNADALQRAAGLGLLHALTIATRSQHNRAVLQHDGLLPELTRLLKLAMQRLNTLAGFGTGRDAHVERLTRPAPSSPCLGRLNL